MAINSIYPEQYEQRLQDKATAIQQRFADLKVPPAVVHASPASHFRMRAEFKIWHEGEQSHYAMYEPGEYKKPFIIDDYPMGSATIERLMPALLAAINGEQELRHRLFQVEFLTTTTEQAVVTLIYHRPLGDDWLALATTLEQQLNCHIIGRSKKRKHVISQDFVTETLAINGRDYHYQQVETGFTQPNAAINQTMLHWACEQAQAAPGDLLELYCGNGNFTLPLASHFPKVLATEINKTSVKSAHYNLEKNGVDNVTILRLSSEEMTQALNREREFRRLKEQQVNLDDYDLQTVLVDPPRAGLDEGTCQLIQRFEQIIYISCNPQTLQRDVAQLQASHDVTAFALFDQFPYTEHMECGMLLRKK